MARKIPHRVRLSTGVIKGSSISAFNTGEFSSGDDDLPYVHPGIIAGLYLSTDARYRGDVNQFSVELFC
ncbi:hypothetical protein FACS1894161_4890 [Spirochaetia bacterium]|nr:hypothetical protein FACS1894161_4890 [Spirochaetia bacterium]